MASTAQIERAAMLGLAVSVQPTFDRVLGCAGGLYDTGLGWERAATMNPFRTMLERGIEVGAGSDTPITPFDPMLSIAACETITTRRSGSRGSRRSGCTRRAAPGSDIRRRRRGRSARGCTRTWWCSTRIRSTAESVEALRPVLTVSLGREVFAR